MMLNLGSELVHAFRSQYIYTPVSQTSPQMMVHGLHIYNRHEDMRTHADTILLMTYKCVVVQKTCHQRHSHNPLYTKRQCMLLRSIHEDKLKTCKTPRNNQLPPPFGIVSSMLLWITSGMLLWFVSSIVRREVVSHVLVRLLGHR